MTVISPPLTQLSVVANFVHRHATEILFDNASLHGGPFCVSLAEMCDGQLANNNCWLASKSLQDFLEKEGVASNLVELRSDKGSHWAVECEGMIIDYTFSQFNPSAPFPLVVPPDVWKRSLDAYSDWRPGFGFWS